MLENFNSTTELRFKELSPEDKDKKGILGRLYGPIASIVKSTRNGRKYTSSLWEKVFSNPITQEMLNNGGIPGELDHPIDREETDSSRIAIMMPEAPSKDKNGNLMGYFDIIDTPCGKIAYSLAKYGFNLGISSRGTGDTYVDENGEETVDEDTYSFTAFDLVLLPACEGARLTMVESLDTNKANFKKSLKESLDNSTTEEQKIMLEVLESLNIDFDKSSSENEVEENVDSPKEEAGNAGDELMESLQESLLENKRLQAQIIELQEKLSVSYTKGITQEQDISKLKLAVRKLSESKTKEAAMSSQLQTMKTQLEEKVRECISQGRIIEKYQYKLKDALTAKELVESQLDNTVGQVKELNGKVRNLNESIRSRTRTNEKELSEMSSKITSLQEELEIRDSQYSKKLKSNNAMVEKYKKIANESVVRYINAKATIIGVSANEIRNRLNENYTFDDIDEVCESLRNYKRNMSKLPFSLNETLMNTSRVSMKEGASHSIVTNPDDVVDQSLVNLVNN